MHKTNPAPFRLPKGRLLIIKKQLFPLRARERLFIASSLVYFWLLSNYKTNPSSNDQVRSVSRPGKLLLCHWRRPASHDQIITSLISASWIAMHQQLIEFKRQREKTVWMFVQALLRFQTEGPRGIYDCRTFG